MLAVDEFLPRDYLLIITQDYNNLRLMAGHCWGYKALALLLNSGHVCRATPTPELPVGMLGPLCYCPKVQLPPLPSLLPSPLYSGVPQRAPLTPQIYKQIFVPEYQYTLPLAFFWARILTLIKWPSPHWPYQNA